MFFEKTFIYQEKNFLNKDVCENLIKLYEKSEKNEGTISINNNVIIDKKLKNCQEVNFNFENNNSLIYIIKSSLGKTISEYEKKFPFVRQIRKYGLDSDFKIQKYNIGESYSKEHCENSGYNDRVLAWMIYLNDVKYGGQTVFPSQNKKFKPEIGKLLIWPSFFTHSHYGLPSKTSIKYIMTGWFKYI